MSFIECLAQRVPMQRQDYFFHIDIHTDATVLRYYTRRQISRYHFDYFVLLMALIA